MKLSTRTRYGLRAILELAEHSEQGPLQLRVIAGRQEVSAKYLEQLMSVLKSAGLVRSVRGARGGYVLARPPGKIRLSEVFHCLEGRVTTAECVESRDACRRSADCAARLLWTDVQNAVENVLNSATLQDLINRSRRPGAVDYQI